MFFLEKIYTITVSLLTYVNRDRRLSYIKAENAYVQEGIIRVIIAGSLIVCLYVSWLHDSLLHR
jgi:hypothetical protein